MKFKVFVGVCLVAISYGALYNDLPCWAQVFQPSLGCMRFDLGPDETSQKLNKLFSPPGR